jgi:DNA-binding MarR family transcriptional regulator
MIAQPLTLEISTLVLSLNSWAQKTWGITSNQMCLLKWIASPREKSEVITMTDISRKMGHSTAAATGMIDRLEKLGYMERTHAVDDRRKVIVCVTEKGLEILNLWDKLHSTK